MTMSKRTLLAGVGAGAAALFGARFVTRDGDATAAEGSFEVTKTAEEWREQLTDMQFAVLREEGTERAFTSPLNKETREGAYHCAGCDQHVYNSDTKFDSGTGWPSFWAPVEGNVANKTDFKLIYPRTEEHCGRCGGHLGHVFDDGPQPTGKRHCINGVALVFKPADGGEPVMG